MCHLCCATMVRLLFSILALVILTQAQIERKGPCPDLPVMENFQPTEYTGIWYEYEKYPASFQSNPSICSFANYTLKPKRRIDVVNKALNKLTGKYSAAHGEAYAPDQDEPSKLLVKFDRSPAPPGPYWVLDTDYENYSIVYNCKNKPGNTTRLEIVWILARKSQGPGAQLVVEAEGLLIRLGVSTRFFRKSNQTGCASTSSGGDNINGQLFGIICMFVILLILGQSPH
ncbi:apolipoprotein D-like [Lineus longissimus]|uniref:apolipoprotein D-like n=1 Tax=Lineus longissimus TaxID=88925 RepID=UPI002B4CB35A